jgi:type IV pilus assembly protein PilF
VIKGKTIFATIVAVTMLNGCVTTGDVQPRRASDQEAGQANLDLGVGYLSQGRADAAIDPLLRAIDLNPRLVDAHSTLALAYDQIENFEQAEFHHLRATQLEPGNHDSQNRYAVFLCRQNRWPDAEPYFARAIRNSDNAAPEMAMLNASVCARSADDFGGAESYLRSVLELDSGNVAALEGMIDISIRTENHLQGRAFLQRLFAATNPASSHLLFCYVIEAELGDTAAAGDCAARLRTEYPRAPEIRQLRELQRNGG